ncbi:hypothetical protein NDU88_006293 [Pleurodeles waltl]|uniref:Uncharacterized protein n=1 Tax=Pleurodeles waltl TaxID=8319 RepID=A0AAV7WE98_PLEWA|nr:hypothetical protein NDU88_006293 [Pleurodeles waltl]
MLLQRVKGNTRHGKEGAELPHLLLAKKESDRHRFTISRSKNQSWLHLGPKTRSSSEQTKSWSFRMFRRVIGTLYTPTTLGPITKCHGGTLKCVPSEHHDGVQNPEEDALVMMTRKLEKQVSNAEQRTLEERKLSGTTIDGDEEETRVSLYRQKVQ